MKETRCSEQPNDLTLLFNGEFLRSMPIAAPDVCRMLYRLKVFRIYAPSVSTKMVKVEAVRNWTTE